MQIDEFTQYQMTQYIDHSVDAFESIGNKLLSILDHPKLSISVRLKDGFIINTDDSFLPDLDRMDLVYVKPIKNGYLYKHNENVFMGMMEPSPDTQGHDQLYQLRPSLAAIICGQMGGIESDSRFFKFHSKSNHAFDISKVFELDTNIAVIRNDLVVVGGLELSSCLEVLDYAKNRHSIV